MEHGVGRDGAWSREGWRVEQGGMEGGVERDGGWSREGWRVCTEIQVGSSASGKTTNI